MRVFINPGHDMELDSGAVSPRTGRCEADIASRIGGMVENYLLNAGCEVRLLQSDNLNGETPDRPCVCYEANSWPSNVFVSIHCNSAESDLARGTETLCYSAGGRGEKLARCIQKQIVDSIGTVDRGVKVRDDLIVLKRTNMPAVLVELAFLSNEDDEKLLVTKFDEFARAVARGITDYEVKYF